MYVPCQSNEVWQFASLPKQIKIFTANFYHLIPSNPLYFALRYINVQSSGKEINIK